jgi:hypothetical protein
MSIGDGTVIKKAYQKGGGAGIGAEGIKRPKGNR